MTSSPQPSSYLKLLPGIYSKPETLAENPFLGQYLKIFEKLMTGLDNPEDLLNGRKAWGQLLDPLVFGNFFYPRFSFLFPNDNSFMPPLEHAQLEQLSQYLGLPLEANSTEAGVKEWMSEMLDFLASWIGLVLDQDMSLDHRRNILARVMPLFRKRGTQEGLQAMIDLMTEFSFVSHKPLTVKVCDITQATPWRVGSPKTRLLPHYRRGAAVLGGIRPWFFVLRITIHFLPDHCCHKDHHLRAEDYWDRIQESLIKLYALVDKWKPEHTTYKVRFSLPPRVGSARLGQSSMLCSIPLQPQGENHD